MGAKSFFEKCFGVEFGPNTFKSGIPKVMVPGCVLMFLAIFFLVIGVLLCGVHAAYEVSRVDETYEDYFLIAGIIGVVIGFVLALVGIGWCCHVRSHMQEEMAYYHDTKLARSASIRSGINANEMALSYSHGSLRSASGRGGGGGGPPLVRDDRGYPYEDNWGGSISSGPSNYQDPNDVHLPQRQQPYRSDDAATRISHKLNKGVKDFQHFVNRNTGGSPQRVPYTDRLSRGAGGPQQEFNHPADEDNPVDEHGNFDLSRTYNKQQQPPYHHGSRRDRRRGPEEEYEEEYEEGAGGGYANIPDANAHMPRRQPEHQQQGQHHALPPSGARNTKMKRRGQQGEAATAAVPAEVYAEPPQHQPDEAAQRRPNTEAYKYHQGRPQDSQGSRPLDSQGRPLDSQDRPLDSSVDSENENTTLVYNPKDGQWYYYYKGRPVSVYTGNNPEKDAAAGPRYRYINGKPALVTKSTENLEQRGLEKSTEI